MAAGSLTVSPRRPLGVHTSFMRGTMSGYIQVTVQGSGFHHSTLIPAVNPQSLWHVNQIVNFARTLAAAA